MIRMKYSSLIERTHQQQAHVSASNVNGKFCTSMTKIVLNVEAVPVCMRVFLVSRSLSSVFQGEKTATNDTA